MKLYQVLCMIIHKVSLGESIANIKFYQNEYTMLNHFNMLFLACHLLLKFKPRILCTRKLGQ